MPAASIIRSAKNKVCQYTSAQVKVREATSNDPNGPSQAILVEIAVLSQNSTTLEEMLQILIKRLNDDGKNWRHIYKSLIVFQFLCLCGNGKILKFCKKNRHLFESLKSFQHFDKEHRDFGSNVRQKALEFSKILDDPEAFKMACNDFDSSKAIDQNQLNFMRDNGQFGAYNTDPHQINEQRQRPVYGGTGVPAHQPTVITSIVFFYSYLSPDMQQALPQTVEEEEAQLQKALELSKEEVHVLKNRPTSKNHQPDTKTAISDDLLDLDFPGITTNQKQLNHASSYNNVPTCTELDILTTPQHFLVPDNTPSSVQSFTAIENQKQFNQYQTNNPPIVNTHNPFAQPSQPVQAFDYNFQNYSYSNPTLTSMYVNPSTQSTYPGSQFQQPNLMYTSRPMQPNPSTSARNPFLDDSTSRNAWPSNQNSILQPERPFDARQTSPATMELKSSPDNKMPIQPYNDPFSDLITPSLFSPSDPKKNTTSTQPYFFD